MPRRSFRLGLVVLSSIAGAGCSQAFWQGVADGAAAASGASAPSGGGLVGQEILVFGGSGHKTFLGCLTCSEYNSSSLLNQYGSYGSAYSSTSIFNKYGDFGSPYSSHSACNQYANDPPVLVDRSGAFYGRLTLNRYHKDAISDSKTVAWLAAVCSR